MRSHRFLPRGRDAPIFFSCSFELFSDGGFWRSIREERNDVRTRVQPLESGSSVSSALREIGLQVTRIASSKWLFRSCSEAPRTTDIQIGTEETLLAQRVLR